MFNNKKIIIGISALVILIGGWLAFQKILIVSKKNTCEKEGGAWNGESCQMLLTIWEEEKACVDKGNIWNGKSCEKKKVESRWSEFKGKLNWYGAKEECQAIGMKLPKVEELKSAYTSGITKSWESDGLFYWSSTPVGENSAKILDVYDGQSYDNPRENFNYVRCVR